MVSPAPGRPVTTPFGQKGDWWATGEHGGVDYGCPSGDPVHAMWGGTVTSGSWGSAYGNHVIIDHDKLPNGDPGLWAAYCHLKTELVHAGDRVEAGDLIGYSGATGNVSGPHLHVEVQPQAHWVQGSYRNPQPWIDAGGDDVGYEYDYLGKPSGTQAIGTSYEKLDQSTWDAPKSGWENTLVYLNITPTKWAEGKSTGAVRVRIIREADDDATGYQDLVVAKDALEDGGALFTYTYWEKGDGQKTHVEVRCQGGLLGANLTTRYTKKALVS